jgi:hypothetical protein
MTAKGGAMKIKRIGLLFLVISLAACGKLPVEETPTEIPTEKPTVELTLVSPTKALMMGEEEILLNYIVHELAGSEREHRLIAQVTAKNERAHLPTEKNSMLRCWRFLNDALLNCTIDEFTESFGNEETSPWNNSYVIFAVINVNTEFDQASVRLDEVAGINSSKGISVKLFKSKNEWQIESTKMLWTS